MSPGASEADAIQDLEAHGQGHLVEHAATLPETERSAFLVSAAAHPWGDLRDAIDADPSGSHPASRPPQALTWARQVGQGPLRPRLRGMGRGLLGGGRVACLLLAGGQGTRLGVRGPKGNVVFGPEADRTLYRIHAERVAALSRAAGKPVPFYVLTSPQTDMATREAFEQAERWGLAPDQIRFLVQGTLPTLDDEGRALLAAPGRLALAPDGHGGAYEALLRAGVLDELRDRGVDVLTTWQVDNPLGRPLDPVMLGWMVERKLEATGKAVRKSAPDEKVGVYARDVRGRTHIVEYTEVVSAASAAMQAGEPMEAPLNLGSIAIHGFAVSFLRRLAEADFHLPLHRARKKVAHLDASGQTLDPTEPNAWKLERFIFDLFPEARRAEVHEVRREWEFAPVKNAEGVDSLVSARVLVDAEVRRWHEERGLALPEALSLRPLELDGGPEVD